MKFSRTDHGAETLLRIEGTLDAATAPDLRPTLDQIVAEGKQAVVVDLSMLELIDSSGVGVIVSLYKRLKANGGDVRVVGVRDQPLAILRLLRMDRIFLR
jgi:anti-sigma B factor antagonist